MNPERRHMKKLRKALISLVIVLLSLVLIIVGGINILFRVNYSSFYKTAQRGFKIPDLGSGFIPQGLTDLDGENFLICGYMKDGSASRIYRSADSGDYCALYTANGEADDCHAGGIAVSGAGESDLLYLANGERLAVYSVSDVLRSDSASPIAVLDAGVIAAFVTVYDGYLFVGEFYREENYPTDVSHHVTLEDGGARHALMLRYKIEESGGENPIRIESTPDKVYSIPDLAQGVCFDDNGNMYISTSWGTSSSIIYVYDYEYPEALTQEPATADPRIDVPYAQVSVLGQEYSARILVPIETIKTFPMVEEMMYRGGRVYLMCESASAKYFFGKLTLNNYVYSMPQRDEVRYE